MYIGAGKAVRTGANLLVTYEDATTETIPVTVGMLLDLTGHFNAVQYTSAQGDYVGLAVYYRDNWLPDFTLHVIPKDDYPDYPEAACQSRQIRFRTRIPKQRRCQDRAYRNGRSDEPGYRRGAHA